MIGNAVVGQSGGPTAAINATLAGVLRGVHTYGAGKIEKIFGMRYGVEGLLRGDLIDLSEVAASEEQLFALAHTPAAGLGSCRRKLPKLGEDDAVYETLLDVFRQNNIRYFFYIGGNDSMDAVAKLSAYVGKVGYEMRVIGVPKTIDNDLVMTDHTPGYGSAAKYIAVTLQEILYDCAVYTVPAVTVVEIMGRDAGWLTAAAGMGAFAGGREVDLIYLPERAFDMERFFDDVKKAFDRHPNVVVAVSEGLRDANGRYVGEDTQSGVTDAFGHKYLAGVAKTLERAVKERFGCKVRSIELNLPQRCAAHLLSATDIEEAQTIGAAAVRMAACEGVSGCMMAFERTGDEPYAVRVVAHDVAKIANQVRKVPSEYINEESNGVTEACARYLLPLLAGETSPEYRNGLPVYMRLV